MTTKGQLSKGELFISLPVSFILIGVALWNWSHGFSHFINWIWLLIGLNRLLVLARKAFPRWFGIINTLTLASSFTLIVLVAYIAFRHFL
ncbi:MAG TPA: hypothetical protein GX518_01355 [Firmicutes bacterium]|nr:hypothetical protein [Bacillota bacterium]